MHILYIEDENEKYMDVARALRSGGYGKAERSRNLSDAKEKIRRSTGDGSPYDLILTDMSYPSEEGAPIVVDAGEQLIEYLKNEGISIPVIVVSSVRRNTDASVGYVVYNARKNDWERELVVTVQNAFAGS